MLSKINLFIAVASGRGWASRFGHSVANMMLNIGLNKLEGRLNNFHFEVSSQAYLVAARQSHLLKAIEGGYTYFLSLDDDMTFPKDVVEKFLKNEDKDILTCNYRKKIPDRIEYVCSDLKGQMLDSTNRTGLERINAMGMGMTFINVNAVKRLKPEPPHFAVLWDKLTNSFAIEDAIFSVVLREAGLELWVDHDLSREIGHIGEIEYKLPPLTIEGN